MMREIEVGDAVLLHQIDGSSQLYCVVHRLSPTEVQLNTFDTPSFHGATAPIYQRGTLPGQWEPINEPVPERVRWYGERLRLSNHPAMHGLHSFLTVKLPDDIEEAFSMVGRIYADKDLRGFFYEVKHRDGDFNNDDYLYNLLMMGVQEGLRSTLYFLQRFLSVAEVVKVNAAAIVADVKPTHYGAFMVGPGALNAEYEGFMLLSRATLDRLNNFFKYYFQTKITNPKQSIDNLYKLETVLKKSFERDTRVQSLLNVMNQHRTYLDTQFAGQGQSTERNRLAHQEYVGFAWPNIHYTPDGLLRVSFVNGENLQADATEELTNRFDKLQLFIVDVLNDFFSD